MTQTPTSPPRSWLRWFSLTLLLPLFALGGCHHARKPDRKAATIANFRSGMLAYLKARGDLCLGKQFPIDVSEREMTLGSRNALQMPVLERAGLVTSREEMGEVSTEDGPVPTKVRRYRLTDAGQRYYLSRPVPGETNQDGQPVVRSDLCAAKFSLDQVVSFELSPSVEHAGAVVSYTYNVEAAPWTREPEVRQVFPAVEHVISGEHTAQLKEAFTLTEAGWVASELTPHSRESVANR